jgi:FkbM family methyltransferase
MCNNGETLVLGSGRLAARRLLGNVANASMTTSEIHIFNNGLRVYRKHLIPAQLKRYQVENIHEPEEEEYFIRLLESLPDNGVFFDVGAAIGYYCLLAKKLKPQLRVHAFEPLPLHQKYFAANLQLNGLSAADVVLHKEALAAHDGRSAIRAHHFGSSLIRQKPVSPKKPQITWMVRLFGRKMDSTPAEGPITVPTATVDGVLQRLGCSVDLAKVDVQGFECEVLEGASASMTDGRIHNWLIGTHSQYLHEQCLDLLKYKKYRVIYEEQQPKEQPDGIVIASRQ